MTRPRTLFLTLAALLVIATPAQADITVNTRADVVANDGLCSLREAVGQAADCGTGTIHLPGGAPYLLASILPMPAGATTRIEGEGAVLQASGIHRLIVVTTAATVRLSNLTIKGGTATPASGGRGGGIVNFANLTLVGVTVTGNTVQPAADGTDGGATGGTGSPGGTGGGINNEPSGTLTLLRSTVVGNSAGAGGEGGDPGLFGAPGGAGGRGGSGGGIFNAGVLTLTESTVTGNTAGRGGRGAPGTPSAASGGTGGRGGNGGTGGNGGGIATDGLGVAGHGTVTIVRSTISGNQAGLGGDGRTGGIGGPGAAGADGGRGGAGGNGGEGGNGGGVHGEFGAVNVVNSTIASNAGGAGGNGGPGGGGGTSGGAPGLDGPGGAGGSGNDGGSGAGVWLGDSSALTHVTIAQNTTGAPGAGGPGGAGNPTAAGGSPGAIADGGAIEVGTGPVSVRNTIFATNGPTSPLLSGGCSGDVTDLGGNVVFASRDCPGLPLDPKLGPLASNGGPTRTMALRAGSPAIDLIRPAGQGCVATDQRGVRRPAGGRCDAGAFEYVKSQPGGGAKPSLGSPRAKFKKRRLTLTYAVSGPGTLAVRVFMKGGRRVGRRTVHPQAAGNVKVTVKLAKKALKALKARGKLRVRTRAVFTPTGGTAITKTKRVTLRKR